MADPHPSSLIDQGAAIEAMTASHVDGGYWDHAAVLARPELADADRQGRWRLIDDLGQDDPAIAAMAERQDYDGRLSDELSKVVRDWMVRRAAFAHRVLTEIPVAEGLIHATRAVACRPETLCVPLGVHWSWDPSWCGGADTYWAPADAGDDVITIHAAIPASSVNWPMTMLCAMDYLCGDDERELRLIGGAPVTITTIEFNGDPVAMPNHLVGETGEPITLVA